MIIRIFIILVIVLSLISLNAQDNLPVFSDVQYELQADSLLKTNQPQEITISISCNSPGELDAYEIKIYDLRVLWTIVSARIDGEPLWLVNMNSRSEKENVLAWYYDREENLVRLHPSNLSSAYTLEVTIQASILQPALLTDSESRLVRVEANLDGQKYRCTPAGSGGEMRFKRKVRMNR